MKDQTARLRALEQHFAAGEGDDYEILRLLGSNDPETRAELGRLVAAGAGSKGMREVAEVCLWGFDHQGESDPAEGEEERPVIQ
jgi:hypothetical protein